MWADLAPIDLAIMWLGVAIAYVVFGISGFGSALIASPLLAFFIPVDKIVPLMALLDCSAAISNVSSKARFSDWREVRRMVPLMFSGTLIGIAILLYTRADTLLLCLGLFVTGYALYSLSGYKPITRLPDKAFLPFGFFGGIFSGLFGSGGFIYAIYLSARIQDKTTLLTTQSTLIGFSTFTRILLFLIAGIYLDWSFLFMALLLLPGMLLGTFIGRRITMRMSRAQFMKILYCIILCSGIALIWRYMSLA